MDMINFDKANAIDQLLERIGIVSGLGAFLAGHLSTVLRKQHDDLEITSIEYIGADNCLAGGSSVSDTIVVLDSFQIPINTHVVLITNSNQMHELDLHVRIIANALDGVLDIKTDVIVRSQRTVKER